MRTHWLLSLVSCAALACAGGPTEKSRAYAHHIAAFNEDGLAAEFESPSLSYPSLRGQFVTLDLGDPKDPDAPFKPLTRGLASFLEHSEKAPRVVIFVHGGLNSMSSSVRRVDDLSHRMMDEGTYPIFISWDSSLASSYLGALAGTSGGRGPIGLFMAPVNFIQDVSRGMSRAAVVVLSEIRSLIGTFDGFERWTFLDPDAPSARETAQLLARRTDCACGNESSCEPEQLPSLPEVPDRANTSVGRNFPETNGWGLLGWTAWFPVRIVGDIVVEGGGSASWVELRRRVSLLSNVDSEFTTNPNTPFKTNPNPPGVPTSCKAIDCPKRSALLQLMQRIRKLQEKKPFELTLIGHSMGAIVVDQLLESDRRTDFVPRIDEIVYLASADSVRGYLNAAIPYLSAHPNASAYHVTLNERAELAERAVNFEVGGFYPLDIAPSGTLLVWLDDFMAEPETQIDRTAGRVANLMQSYRYTPETLRPRVYIKVLPGGKSLMETMHVPQRHGDFTKNDTKFWSRDFYAPACPNQGANGVLWESKAGGQD